MSEAKDIIVETSNEIFRALNEGMCYDDIEEIMTSLLGLEMDYLDEVLSF